jgi:hypothetical protein
MAPNRLHIMLASDELWVVPAGLESRVLKGQKTGHAR